MSKRKYPRKRQAQEPKTSRRSLTFLTILGLIAVVALMAGALLEAHTQRFKLERQASATAKDLHQRLGQTQATISGTLSDQQVISLQQKIEAVLQMCQNDPILGIRETARDLLKRLKNGQAALAVTTEAKEDTVAFTIMDGSPKVPTIMFVGPVVEQRAQNLAPADFDDVITALLCHETLHLQLAPPDAWGKKFDTPEGRKLYVEGEARVWARQIVTITRPMVKSGRGIDGVAHHAEQQFAAEGNENNSGWRKWVEANLCVD